MSKKDYTDITIVLDRSGSMSSVAADTIGGFNRFLSDQKKGPGTATLTLHQFDDQHETLLDAVPIKHAEPLTDKTFVPRGNTALLDAMGRAIESTGKRLKEMREEDRPDAVVFVTITDGHENASREWSAARIKARITEQRNKYSWEFVFLGAAEDAIDVAKSYGFSAANTMAFASNSTGVASYFSSSSDNLTMLRSKTATSMAFTDEDKAKQEAAKK